MWLRATAYDVYIIHDYRAIFCADSQGLIETNPYGGCAEIVRQSCNFSAVTAQSPQAFCGIVRSPCGFRAENYNTTEYINMENVYKYTYE